MKRYFKHDVDPTVGPGIVYFEFDGENATRQIHAYQHGWYLADSPDDYVPGTEMGLTDQPLSVLMEDWGLSAEHEITHAEFERAWEEGMRRSQRQC